MRARTPVVSSLAVSGLDSPPSERAARPPDPGSLDRVGARIALWGSLLWGSLLAGAASPAAEPKYLEDFRFIERTVASDGAAVRSKRIPWKEVCDRMRPEFERCSSDLEHVRNVLRLLAHLGDSHTGVTRSSVDGKDLPSKWDGLYGGGLWFAWEDGRAMLRGILEGHPAEGKVPLGSALVEISGEPAWIALERERRRIARYQGVSSDHSLFSSMGNRLLPFGDRQALDLKLLSPDLRLCEIRVGRWGPGGKAFSPAGAQLPDGLSWKDGAVSKMLSTDWCPKVGYLRITGGMSAETASAFHDAFDALKGMEALLLDCRGMGGGGDGPAWEMAGRLFARRVPNGPGRFLEPTGSWQFEGPVAMLQDETEVSSAETFTWAVSETERVVSVGRPTGGWGIIPRTYACPSGLVDFRLGVRDRPTPIRGVHTEGVGWPPDVRVPYGPVLCSLEDPERTVATEILRWLHAGVPRAAVVELFRRLADGRSREFLAGAARVARGAKGFAAETLAARYLDDLKATLALEVALAAGEAIRAPDVLGASRRLEGLLARARGARLSSEARTLQQLLARARSEIAAQTELLERFGDDLGAIPDAGEAAAFLKRHGKTRLGAYLRTRWSR